MILYFANRKMEILGHATTTLPDGFVIVDDAKTEEVDTGATTFSCTIAFEKENRLQLEEMAEVGNYLLRNHGEEKEFFTIIDVEIDTKNQELYIYAEDVGLDLLNEIAREYTAPASYTIDHYINKWIGDSGFEIGINEVPSTTTRKLSWDGESTVTERLASIATQFGDYELSFSFETKGLVVTNRYVNIHEKRGKNVGEQLCLNKDIDRIVIKKSVANLATGFSCKGGTPEGSENPITLKGYKYDDGDFYVGESTGYLYSRKASEKWGRYAWAENINPAYGGVGFIIRPYSYDTTDQATLCSHAIAELKKVCDMEVNYEVDITSLSDSVKIGDTINIVDDAGKLYLSSRVLVLETSVTGKSRTATLGEYLIKNDGMSSQVLEMASKFAELSNDSKRLEELAETAKKEAETAKNTAETAQSTAAQMTSKVDAAQSAADAAAADAALAKAASSAAESTANSASSAASTAQTMANNALAEATNAKKVATNYIGYGSNGLLIGNLTETTLGRNVLIDSTSVNIRAGETILASFGEKNIELGKGMIEAQIGFCNNRGVIYMETENGTYNTLVLSTAGTLKFVSSVTRVASTTFAIDGDTRTQGDVDVSGRVGCLTLTSGGSTLNGTTKVANAEMTLASVAGTLTIGSTDVLGALVVNGTVNATGAISGATLSTTGAATLASLTVSGTTTLSGTTTAGRINASNVYLIGSLYVGGKSSTSDGKTGVAFGASGNITMQGSSAPTLNFIAGTATKAQASLKSDSSGVITLSGGGLLVPNAYPIIGKDANGNNVEMARVGGDKTEAILILGDSLYVAGAGRTNVCSGTSVTLLTSKERVRLSNSDNASYSAFFMPYTNGKCTLGHANYKWHTVYASNASINTSDRREKENIMPLGKNIAVFEEDGEKKTVDLHSALFDKLQPVQYNFINGNGRICYGLIAQDIVEAMRELEIGENELDLVHHDFWKDEETGETTETFGLAYNNLIAMLIHEVQKLKTEVATLKTA